MLLSLLAGCVFFFLVHSPRPADSQTIVDVWADEQYATVLCSSNYVYNNGTVGASPSLFIGLFHLSIREGPGLLYTMQTVVWHQVDFATQIEMRVAPAGFANTELLPAYILATGPAAPASNSPIFGSFTIDEVFLNYLRTSLVYVQILADQPAGLLRGQLESRRDVLVAFPSLGPFTGTQYDATAGMALVYFQPAPQRRFVTLTHWILSRYAAPSIWNANDGFSNFTTAVIFGAIPVTQTTGVTLTITPDGVVPVVCEEPLVYTSPTNALPGQTGPITGPGSSKLVLVRQGNFIEEVFSDFIRLAYYEDRFFANITAGAGSSFSALSIYVSVILTAVFLFL